MKWVSASALNYIAFPLAAVDGWSIAANFCQVLFGVGNTRLVSLLYIPFCFCSGRWGFRRCPIACVHILELLDSVGLRQFQHISPRFSSLFCSGRWGVCRCISSYYVLLSSFLDNARSLLTDLRLRFVISKMNQYWPKKLLSCLNIFNCTPLLSSGCCQTNSFRWRMRWVLLYETHVENPDFNGVVKNM